MKKLISLILAAVMLMSLLSVSAFAKTDYKEVSADDAVDEYSNGIYLLQVTGNCIIKESGRVNILDLYAPCTLIIDSGVTLEVTKECFIGEGETIVCLGNLDISGGDLTCFNYPKIIIADCSNGQCSFGWTNYSKIDKIIKHVDHYFEDNVCLGCGGKYESGSLGNNLSYTISGYDMTISGSGAIPERAFYDRTDIHSVTIEEGITGINKFAFCNCKNIESVSLPDTIEYIEYCAFRNCYKLEEINIPNGMNSIGEYAFDTCTALYDIEIPSTVTFIDVTAFGNCSNLTATLHRTENTEIKYGAFNLIKKLIVMVPDGWRGDNNDFGAYSCEYVKDTYGPENGYYIIRSAVDPNFCLDIIDADENKSVNDEGDNVHLSPVNSAQNNKFRIVKNGSKGYKIEAVHSGMVLDVAGCDTQNEGINIYQWTDYGNANQRWIIERASGENCYFIHSAQSGYAGWMDASGCVNGATPDYYGSTNVQSWSYTGAPNQQWILEKVENDTSATGSVISEGNIWIVAAIGAVAVIAIAAVVIKKKKK